MSKRMSASDVPREAADVAYAMLRVVDRDGVDRSDVFASGVRGQESMALDLQFGGVECTAAEDKARQEYALSSDLAYQVQKFGWGHAFPTGEQDFDLMDLTKAMEVIEESQAAWHRLPKVVRDRYRSWSNVEKAAKSGELEQLLKTSGASAGGSGEAKEVSPSDSAAERGPKA